MFVSRPRRTVYVMFALAAATTLACTPSPAAKPAATEAPRATVAATTAAPTTVPAPTAAKPAAAPTGPDAARGAELFAQKGCAACHGAQAQGQIGPKIAGTQLTIERVRTQVRNGGGGMPPFAPEVVTDADVEDIYAHLKSLAP